MSRTTWWRLSGHWKLLMRRERELLGYHWFAMKHLEYFEGMYHGPFWQLYWLSESKVVRTFWLLEILFAECPRGIVKTKQSIVNWYNISEGCSWMLLEANMVQWILHCDLSGTVEALFVGGNILNPLVKPNKRILQILRRSCDRDMCQFPNFWWR